MMESANSIGSYAQKARSFLPVFSQSPELVYLNCGATTPPLQQVVDTVAEMSKLYGPIGRGNGPLSEVATAIRDKVVRQSLEFVSADQNHFAVAFTQNATYTLNMLIHGLGLTDGDIVLHTVYGHNSTTLPLNRTPAFVFDVDLGSDYRLNMNEMMEKIRRAGRNLKAVVLTHASNLTGHIVDALAIADVAHKTNPRSYVIVDAAQTFAHIPIDMGDPHYSSHIDMLAACGHKAYAPYGSALYVAPIEFFEKASPLIVGGGTVEFVNCLKGNKFLPGEKKFNAGTPNLIGMAAFARAMAVLNEEFGLQQSKTLAHEIALKRWFYEEIARNPIVGLRLFDDFLGEKAFENSLGNILLLGATKKHQTLLAAAGVEARLGNACADMLGPRLLANGLGSEGKGHCILTHNVGGCFKVLSMIRLTPGIFTTVDDLQVVIDALREKPRSYVSTISAKEAIEKVFGSSVILDKEAQPA